jgi:hypothetical protein
MSFIYFLIIYKYTDPWISKAKLLKKNFIRYT